MLSRLFIVAAMSLSCLVNAADAQDQPKEADVPKVFLCTLIYEIPWTNRAAEPRGYQREHKHFWIEVYFPQHKVAYRMGTEGFFEADANRYKRGKSATLVNPSVEHIEKLWRTHGPTHAEALNDLTLTDRARQDVERRIAEYLKKKAEK